MARVTAKAIMQLLDEEQERLTKLCEFLSRELDKAERGEPTVRRLTHEQLERRWMMNENKLREVLDIKGLIDLMMRRAKQ